MTRTVIPRPRALRRSAVRRPAPAALAGAILAFCAAPLFAQGAAMGSGQEPTAVPTAAPILPAGPTYAELVELAQAAEIAVIAVIADQARVPAERAPGLAAGKARLYLEAETEALLSGRAAIGQSLRFLADRELDSRGRPPRLEDQRYLLFARMVPGRPGELQLASPAAMLPAEPGLVERARMVLRQVAEGPPLPRVTGVREVISVAGNLAGESETQMFLETAGGEPVSLTVLRRPGMAPEWGVSWTDIVDPAARPAAPETLAWYGLACFLPETLPEEAFLQDEAEARARAREDYAFVLAELGECERTPASDAPPGAMQGTP